MRKAWIVAKHEFRVVVKRWWFIVATFILPLVSFLLFGGMALLAKETVEETEREYRGKPLGVVDLWGGLKTEPSGFQIRKYSDSESAVEGLKQKEVGVFIVLQADYLETGRVRTVTMRRPTLLTAARLPLPEALEGWLVDNVLRDSVDARRVERAKRPLEPEPVYLDATGSVSTEDAQAALRRSWFAYGFFFLLFFSILSTSAYLLQGMAEEKENRVMEMVLSSVTPTELMFGKLAGLGAAGLLQLAIWVVMGVTGILAFAVQIVLEPGLFFFCLLFFLLGYVLYGSLMLGFGSLGTNFRESQQMASIWSFVAVSPLVIMFALFETPHAPLARVFSFIPFTAPTTMMFRYTIDPKGTPALDIAAAVVILAASTFLAIKVSARLYRAGLLLYGKRPGVREIWRWLLAAR